MYISFHTAEHFSPDIDELSQFCREERGKVPFDLCASDQQLQETFCGGY